VHAADNDVSSTSTAAPASVVELRNLQKRVQETYKKVLPAVVGVQIGNSSGSGVIVSEDGFVLTAGHVSGAKDSKVILIMPDGKRINAKSRGANRDIDSGMIKITDEGKWPYVEMGDSTTLKKGQWTIALGHPGGYFPGRAPVLRLGRIQDIGKDNDRGFIQTDCTLVGGDSGGPLFDLDGKVIGIHSRIGPAITFNIHVPVSTYRDTWERLASGEAWGNGFGVPASRPPVKPTEFGAKYALIGGVLSVREVQIGSLAEKAGLKPKDTIAKFDGQTVSSKDDIEKILKEKKNGDTVVIEVERGDEKLELKIVIKNS
jgi:serine protease Do